MMARWLAERIRWPNRGERLPGQEGMDGGRGDLQDGSAVLARYWRAEGRRQSPVRTAGPRESPECSGQAPPKKADREACPRPQMPHLVAQWLPRERDA